LCTGADLAGAGLPSGLADWPKTPRALAGRLRRAQPFLRALGIEVAFSREDQSGNRVIRIRMGGENTVSTVSTVSNVRSVRHNDGPCQPAAGAAGDARHRAAATAAADADGADGADAKSAVHFG